MFSVLPSTLLALFAAGSLVFGAALPTWPWLKSRFFEDRLSLLIGFSAGLMLATALHELLPEAAEISPQHWVWGATAGFLTLYMAERLTHFHACRHRHCEIQEEEIEEHCHEDEDDHFGTHHSHSSDGHAVLTTHHSPLTTHPSHVHHADTMALVGMSIHNFTDGLTTAAAFAVSHTVGIMVVLAIVLHQMAAGLSLGAIMLRVGRSHRRVLISTSVAASFIVWGALFYHGVLPLQETTQGILLGLAGGSFLYVAACDLLPEAHATDEGWTVMAMTLVGFIFVLLVKMLFH
ncbi:MAG: ZIP family metal transporter [Armatimonadota bacterium]|nr:ZIP family metal transporter [Armatimonadota bacterium]